MAVAAERTVGLPPGPREPKVAQAFRYSRQFPEYTAEQYARHGASWTLRLPGLPDAVITTDRELIRSVFTGDPTSRRHANDIFVTSLGPRSVMLLEPQPHLGRRRLLLPPFHGERVSVYAQLMRELVDAELNTWSGEVGVHQRARHLTVGVIQSAVLGSRDPAFEAELARLMDVFASPLANFGLFAPALQRRSRWNVLAEPFHREAD
ncbi:MAG: cytochrome family [Solirubrobacteraceae bacterium]|nr:cytochrome family [Solirubrobacteraceae bacterium]